MNQSQLSLTNFSVLLHFLLLMGGLKTTVFSVNLVCKKELNLMLKVSGTSSQGAVGLSLRGTDFFLPILYDLNNNSIDSSRVSDVCLAHNDICHCCSRS